MHAHVSTESADCDGRYSREYVLTADKGQSDFDFKAATIGNALYAYDRETTARFTPDGFSFNAPTEEGYVHSDFTWCDDDDADRRGTFRDHSAEAMGY